VALPVAVTRCCDGSFLPHVCVLFHSLLGKHALVLHVQEMFAYQNNLICRLCIIFTVLFMNLLYTCSYIHLSVLLIWRYWFLAVNIAITSQLNVLYEEAENIILIVWDVIRSDSSPRSSVIKLSTLSITDAKRSVIFNVEEMINFICQRQLRKSDKWFPRKGWTL
jgi:hypothetical protein